MLAHHLDALSYAPRRQALLALVDHSPCADLPAGTDGDLEAVTEFREEHLGSLEEAGFVDYDRENHQVTKGPRFDRIEPLLRLVAEDPVRGDHNAER